MCATCRQHTRRVVSAVCTMCRRVHVCRVSAAHAPAVHAVGWAVHAARVSSTRAVHGTDSSFATAMARVLSSAAVSLRVHKHPSSHLACVHMASRAKSSAPSATSDASSAYVKSDARCLAPVYASHMACLHLSSLASGRLSSERVTRPPPWTGAPARTLAFTAAS